MTMNHAISTDLVAAYSVCKRKAFLLLRGDSGDAPHEFVRLFEGHSAVALDAFLKSMQSSGLTVSHHSDNDRTGITGKVDVLTHVSLAAADLETTVHALVRLTPATSRARTRYEPYLVIGSHTITKADKIRLAFCGYVLAETHSYRPQAGVIVNVGGNAQRIQLTQLMTDIVPSINTLRTWKADLPSNPPQVVLNDNCPICPFKKLVLLELPGDLSLACLRERWGIKRSF